MCLGQIVLDCDKRYRCRGCCDFCCDYCGTLFKFDKRQNARFTHFYFFTQIVFLTIIVTKLRPQIFQVFAGHMSCPGNPEEVGYLCLSLSIVYRVSLALVSVFALILLVTLSRDAGAKVCNEGCWLWKVLLFVAVFFGLLFLDNRALVWFIDTSRILSIFFFVFLVFMLTDFSYTWGERWVRRYDAGATEYKCYLLFFTGVLFAVVGYLFIRGLGWFSGDGCGWNVFALVFALLQCIIVTGLSISGLVTNGSILTSAAISALIMTLTVAGLSSDDRKECNSLLGDDHSNLMIIEISVSMAVLVFALVYLSIANEGNSTTSVGLVQQLEMKDGVEGVLEEEVYVDEYGERKTRRILRNNPDPMVWPELETTPLTAYRGRSFIMFQLIMFLASFYFAMLLTNWGSIEIGTVGTDYYLPNDSAYWIKISTSLFSTLVYLWTMIAPRILTNRSFSQ